jgi:hypothetical protein
MITSTHDSVVRRIPHIKGLRRKTIRPRIYIPAQLAFVHSALCNVPHLLKSRPFAQNSTTMTIRGQLFICLVLRRCSVFLVALRLGSGSWCVSSIPVHAMRY